MLLEPVEFPIVKDEFTKPFVKCISYMPHNKSTFVQIFNPVFWNETLFAKCVVIIYDSERCLMFCLFCTDVLKRYTM